MWVSLGSLYSILCDGTKVEAGMYAISSQEYFPVISFCVTDSPKIATIIYLFTYLQEEQDLAETAELCSMQHQPQQLKWVPQDLLLINLTPMSGTLILAIGWEFGQDFGSGALVSPYVGFSIGCLASFNGARAQEKQSEAVSFPYSRLKSQKTPLLS